ncbi:putative 2-polyprenyl-3-methyl-5-hydroxy-6-metoxy-1,4-ben zoquinolmethylase [uncultured Spirochaetota bacterium]|jgi:hypothetical protein|nr:putative 2-polyprenyl-3-methyl-5-hydroxy-6-metoxy-1,4-ben zoquinolmethylase [uncultured Spirochaetota bacterium]
MRGPRHCRLCKSASTRSFAAEGKGATKTYVRCEECGFVGLLPRCFPNKKEEKARYLLHTNDEKSKGYREYLERFLDQALSPYLRPGSSVLDFGSGPAEPPLLPSLIRARGYGCSIYDPYFAPGRVWRARKFSAIALHEVVEHLRRPRQSLLYLVARLSPGGILAIRTRFVPDTVDAFIPWWYRMDSTHLGFFSPESLSRLFEPAGLKLLRSIEPDIMIFRARKVSPQ